MTLQCISGPETQSRLTNYSQVSENFKKPFFIELFAETLLLAQQKPGIAELDGQDGHQLTQTSLKQG